MEDGPLRPRSPRARRAESLTQDPGGGTPRGWETGVGWRWREAPAFYSLLAFFVGFAALFVLIPGLPLIQVMFAAQVLNALLLPFILVFVMRLSADRTLLGPLASGRLLLTIGWTATALLIGLSIILVLTSVIGA